MTGYAPLGRFLAQTQRDEVAMTFEQIERVLGRKLPKSAYAHRPWWSNNPSNNALTQVWLDAGYRTEQVDMHARRLVFRRLTPPRSTRAGGGEGIGALFGKLHGWVRFAPDFDATAPADPELASFLDEKYGTRSRGQGRT
jgi:hypothetical protein